MMVLFAAGCGSMPMTGTDGTEPAADLSVVPLADMTMSAPAPDMTRPAPDMTLVCSTALLGGPQFKTPSDACKTCAMGSCCAELAACTADPECVAQRGCFLNCAGSDDSACTSQCLTDHNHNMASQNVSNCRANNCVNEFTVSAVCHANFGVTPLLVTSVPASGTPSLLASSAADHR